MEDNIFDKVHEVDLKQTMETSYIDYAMSVIASRALPDVRDGLKPVQRRIMYSMIELNNGPDKPHRKCARIVGDTMGKYHPHGDSSIYGALVNMAQEWSTRYPLVDGHGNFGSVDGDPPAAYRYTEARMSRMAVEMLTDIDKDTIDWDPNFDETKKEPSVLPCRFPNLLVNGSSGIAVGMATSIPPHNLGEVIDATIALLHNPDATVDDLMEYIPAPDFPTGALVLGRHMIKQAYRTGRGGCILRAKAEIEEMPNGKSRIIVTEIPYQVNKAKLIENIADQVKDKRLEGISDLREETDRHGMRIVIELKKDVNAQVLLNQLYKQTQMQTSFSMIMLALVDGVPRVLNLKEILECYVAHQKDVIVRRTRFDLEKAQERQHILLGLHIALENIDAIVELLKKSRDRQDAIVKLMEGYGLSDKQAAAILDMRLQRLTGLEVEKINAELEDLDKQIAYFTMVLSSDEEVKNIIVKEMSDIKAQYTTPRLSELTYDYGDIDIEDLIEKEDVVISMTHGGYIKRMPVAEYKAQHRGGMGITAHKAKDEDFVEKIFTSNTHERLMFFTNKGKVFTLKAYEIPEATRNARGRAAVNLLQLEQGEKIQAFLQMPEEREGKFLMLATKQGLIKKTPLEEYDSIKRNGKIAIKFNDDDELIDAVITTGGDELLVASSAGLSIHFNEKDVRPVGRTAMGVKAMNLAEGQTLVAFDVVHQGDEILTVTSNGYGKRSSLDEYPIQNRAGKGVKAGTFNDKTGTLVCLKVIPADTDVMMITDSGVIIRVQADEISKIGRSTQGVRIMKLKDDKFKVMAIALTPHEDEQEEVELDEDGNPIVREDAEVDNAQNASEDNFQNVEDAANDSDAQSDENNQN